jgi:hypothetical protein
MLTYAECRSPHPPATLPPPQAALAEVRGARALAAGGALEVGGGALEVGGGLLEEEVVGGALAVLLLRNLEALVGVLEEEEGEEEGWVVWGGALVGLEAEEQARRQVIC